jgi:hypothetical protein
MNILINIYINGEYNTNHYDNTDTSPVVIEKKGTLVQILASQYNQYIDDLEERGYDSYFCPEMYQNPKWNGEILFLD